MTPLVPSRSLGRLLGLGRLWFKLESCQPDGSWLHRGAGQSVGRAIVEGTKSLAVVGGDPFGPALALQAARADLPVILFLPEDDALPPDTTWAIALGARPVRVACDGDTLRAMLPDVAAGAGLRYVDRADADVQEGLRDVMAEIAAQAGGSPVDVLAIGTLLGQEGNWLASWTPTGTASELVPLRARKRQRRQQTGIVMQGQCVGPGAAASTTFDGPQPWAAVVTTREADAARRLLAREEGLLASRRGVAGLAALMRAGREKVLPPGGSAVVILAQEIGGAGDGPPLAVDETPLSEPVPLEQLGALLRHGILARPG